MKEIDLGYAKIVEGKPHPRYPELIVTKITKDGLTKIKGQKSFCHPRYPFLVPLSKKNIEYILKEHIPEVKRRKAQGLGY